MECGVKLDIKYANCYATIQVGPRPEGDTSLMPSIAISTPKKQAIQAPTTSANSVAPQDLKLDRQVPAQTLNISDTSVESVYNTPRAARMMDETALFYTPMSQGVRRETIFKTPVNSSSKLDEGFFQTPDNLQIPRGKKINLSIV
jgi:hypothetical protein